MRGGMPAVKTELIGKPQGRLHILIRDSTKIVTFPDPV